MAKCGVCLLGEGHKEIQMKISSETVHSSSKVQNEKNYLAEIENRREMHKLFIAFTYKVQSEFIYMQVKFLNVDKIN